MEKRSHQLFSLYARKGSPFLYARFWDEDLQNYTAGRSTGKTDRKGATRECQNWLAQYGGLPPKAERKATLKKETVIKCLTRFLEDAQIIESGQSLSMDEIISKTSVILTGTDFNRDNPIFVEYLLRFWDWEESAYIKDKLESGQTIGKTYCRANKGFIEHHVVPYFGVLRIRSVTTFKLEEFKNQLPRQSVTNPKGLKPRSINAILGCIGTPLGEAKRLGIINENPAANMRKLADKSAKRGILTPEEVQKVLSIDWPDERSKLASQLAACHGLRAGEIGALRIQDIDRDRNIIHIRNSWERLQKTVKSTKNGHERIIYSDKQLIKQLIELHSKNPHGNDFVFWNFEKPDEPMNLDNFINHLRDALVLVGITPAEQKQRNITFHSWRHFSNSVLRGDMADSVLQQAMGHRSEEMTDRYYHMTDEQGEQYRKSVIDKIIPLAFPSPRTA
ncbi:MAG: tyrosine-type recombinase/integrase [Treponemataceae bacterium]